MIQKRIVCDVCGHSPNPGPVWRKVAVEDGIIMIFPLDRQVRKVSGRKVLDVCGVSCALKAVSSAIYDTLTEHAAPVPEAACEQVTPWFDPNMEEPLPDADRLQDTEEEPGFQFDQPPLKFTVPG